MDADTIAELFAAFGPVRCRRMFGGTGVYAGDLMFALEAGGVLYLKADASTHDAFAREGCGPFVHEGKSGRLSTMSYWRVPERLLDEPDELAAWARDALDVARRAKGSRNA